jgi:drug/metabolite transporter (DMT)-like permease
MSEERHVFRYAVGLLAILGGIAGLVGLYFVEVPVGNRDAVVLALGIVLGWGSSVINGEWGSSPAGRRAAEIGTKAAEKAAKEK